MVPIFSAQGQLWAGPDRGELSSSEGCGTVSVWPVSVVLPAVGYGPPLHTGGTHAHGRTHD